MVNVWWLMNDMQKAENGGRCDMMNESTENTELPELELQPIFSE